MKKNIFVAIAFLGIANVCWAQSVVVGRLVDFATKKQFVWILVIQSH